MPYRITLVRKLPPKRLTAQLSLLDFPTELLIAILGQIQSAADLYNVASVCTRLRALALPSFLQHHGIRRPEEEISAYIIHWDPAHEHGRYPDALSGLTISNYITKVNQLRRARGMFFSRFFTSLTPSDGPVVLYPDSRRLTRRRFIWCGIHISPSARGA